MALPEPDLARIEKYCEKLVPAELWNQMRIEHTVRGKPVTLFECRPPWTGDLGTDWSRIPVAQLRYGPARQHWTLYWPDSNSRWHLFDLINPESAQKLLNEIAPVSSGAESSVSAITNIAVRPLVGPGASAPSR